LTVADHNYKALVEGETVTYWTKLLTRSSVDRNFSAIFVLSQHPLPAPILLPGIGYLYLDYFRALHLDLNMGRRWIGDLGGETELLVWTRIRIPPSMVGTTLYHQILTYTGPMPGTNHLLSGPVRVVVLPK